MKIFNETLELVKIERQYTAKILNNLIKIEKDKLYSDLKYPSLHKYLIKGLGYSETEATIRVNAVRLMMRSKSAKRSIEEGRLNLTNASEAQRASKDVKDNSLLERLVGEATKKSTRKFKDYVDKTFKRERQEILVLKEYMLKKMDKLRKLYGDLSTLELIQILVEEKLKAPVALRRLRECVAKNSRSIPKSVKVQRYTGECANCGVKHGLEYDHILKFSHGGVNSAQNIQMLCRSCNQRKEIKARQSNLFL